MATQTDSLVIRLTDPHALRVESAGGQVVLEVDTLTLTTRLTGRLFLNDVEVSAGAGYTDAQAIAAVEGEATLDLTGTVGLADDKALEFGAADDAGLQWFNTQNIFRITANASGSILIQNSNVSAPAGSALIQFDLPTTYHVAPATSDRTDLGIETLRWRNLLLDGFVDLEEISTPSAPGANQLRLYADDNGAGKTRLMVLFATGAAQQIAIEP